MLKTLLSTLLLSAAAAFRPNRRHRHPVQEIRPRQRPHRHHHEDHKAPIVAVNLWYHVGSKNERPGKTGFAHLLDYALRQKPVPEPKGE